MRFSQEEAEVGRKAMKALGIEKKYICIFARDSSYYGETIEGANCVRNTDINALKETAAYFIEQCDIQSVRMGAKVNREVFGKGIVDYASLGRTEFLDVFLFSQCEFFVGTSSGIDCILRLFSKPSVAFDFPCVLPIDEPTMPFHLLIYMKWYDVKKQRYLTLRELVRLQVELKMQAPSEHGMDAFFEYTVRNLKVVHNTPQEILDVAEEMYSILHGTIHYTAHDEAIQRKYRDIIHEGTKKFKNITGNFGRVGTKWLRENAWFLE